MESSFSLTPLHPRHGDSHTSSTSDVDDTGYSPASPFLQAEISERSSGAYSPHIPGATNQSSTSYSDIGPRSKRPTWVPKTCWKIFDPISRHLPTGWRLGTAGAALLTFLILIINISVTAASYSKIRQKGYKTSVAPIRTGKCKDIKESGVLIHLAINVVSTLLLGASSYCMQCVSAPTRKDVDVAHATGVHVDIGIPSYRNLRFIKRRRLLIWICLCLSSVPLHLVYNSTFFVSTNNNMYPIYYADESFAKGAPFNESFFDDKSYYKVDIRQMQLDLVTGHKFQNLTNDECIRDYAKTLVDDRTTLILVVDRPSNCSIFKDPRVMTDHYQDCGNTSATSLYDMTVYSTGIKPAMTPFVSNWYSWICSQPDTYRYDGANLGLDKYEKPPKDMCSDGGWKKELSADPWIVSGGRVRYCLSEKASNQCHLNVAVNLLWVVIGFNLLKLIITCFLVGTSWINNDPLVTVGDAASSFIEFPDEKTKGMCLYTSKEIKGLQKEGVPVAHEYRDSADRWFTAVSKRRWILASILTTLALAIILGLLGYATSVLKRYYNRGDIKSLWGFGFGAITPYTLITSWDIPTQGDAAVVGAVLIANLPQLLLSFLYLILNGLVTSMALSAEWARFAHLRRALRVSFPRGQQRSTYFLQLPYRLGIPLLLFSALLHWLVSQSIFIVQVNEIYPGDENLDPTDLDNEDTLTTCAYSPVAMILTCFAIAILFAFAVVLSRQQLPPGMPLAASCSLAISAACHVPEDTSSLLPVKWGVTHDCEDTARDPGVGHCAFSNKDVDLPAHGLFYA